MSVRPRVALAAALLAAGAACASGGGGAAPAAPARAPGAPPPAPPPPSFAFPFNASGRVDTVGAGVVHAEFFVPPADDRGRMAVHVLKAGPGLCTAALKPGPAATGRALTSALAAKLAERDPAVWGTVYGAVNGDFFSLGTGLPAGAHVQTYKVVAGPARRPVFAVDSSGRGSVGWYYAFGAFVRDNGTAGSDDTLTVSSWNRPAPDAVTAFDGAYGTRTDSVPGRVFVRLRPLRVFAEFREGAPRGQYRVTSVDSGAATGLGAQAYVVAVGPNAPAADRARWSALRPGTVGTFGIGLFPRRVAEAVGGFPVLVRRGSVAAEVDTAGDDAFRGRNPRTAVGVAADGGFLFVTVDGRQEGYSDGATLRQTAELMRALGAVDALNLDGGGSTTMVLRRADGRLGVANRPSDAVGERPVANALALRGCPVVAPAARDSATGR